MNKFLIAALALSGLTQGHRHMNGFDSHQGDHLVHESRVDPIDVGHHRTVPDYIGHEDRIDGHRTSEHHDSVHDKILPQDILEHPLGGAKYEGVHQAVKEDKGIWHDAGHHGGWHGHDGHDGYEHGHDLRANDFVHGFHGHGDDHGHDGHHDGPDRGVVAHRTVHDNPHLHDGYHD